jgi:Domain of unknown function (DUF4136)
VRGLSKTRTTGRPMVGEDTAGGWGPSVTVTPYVEVTIVLDMVDANTDRLVWRAISTKTGSNLIDVQKEKKVDKMVSDAFKHFPPSSES